MRWCLVCIADGTCVLSLGLRSRRLVAGPVLDGFLFLFNDGPRYSLEIGAHPGHEFGIVARPVARDECGEECRSDAQQLEVFFCFWVLAVAEYTHKQRRDSKEDII